MLSSVEAALQRQRVIRYGHRLVRSYVRGYHRVTVVNDCPLPAEGPAILVSNHICGLDPILLQSRTDRLITWMMASEYYRVPSLRWFYEATGAIPVERSGSDLAAMRAALRALEQGRVLGLFPEGRISLDQSVLPFQTGASLLAARTGAAVYPALLTSGARPDMLESLLYPQSIRVAFGPPLRVDGPIRNCLTEATQIIQKAVLALRNDPPTL